MNLHSYFIHLHFILKVHSILASETNSLQAFEVIEHRHSYLMSHLEALRLRSVNILGLCTAVSRSDSPKSLKLKSVILRVWADGTTAALGKGRGRKRSEAVDQSSTNAVSLLCFQKWHFGLHFFFLMSYTRNISLQKLFPLNN